MNEKLLNLTKETKDFFKEWNIIAFALNAVQSRLPFYEREIWSCYLGMNIGYEEAGKGDEFLRPVIILKRFSDEMCWVIPLSHVLRKSEYYYIFQFGTGKLSTALLSQLRLIDVQRLHKTIGRIKMKDFVEIKKRLMKLLS